MQAVILAAGKSQRFYPFGTYGHKSMIPMMGKPLLQHTLEALHKAKITNVVIVVAKDSDIPGRLVKVPDLSVQFVVQEGAQGMGHALLQAESYLEESFFLLSGYHMEISDFAKDMMHLQNSKEKVVLLAKEETVLEQCGILSVDGERVISVVEQRAKTEEKGLRVIAMYLLSKEFMNALRETPIDHYHFEKALDAYAKQGNVVYLKAEKPTISLKYSWDLLQVKDYLLSKIKRSISPKAKIAKSAIIQGDVYIADNVLVHEGACITGPCYIGENAVIGTNAILRNGVIVENAAVIGATMEMKNVFFMLGATTHTGFIGDSVIGAHSRLAAGFCTANVRFDRKEISAVVNDVKINTKRVHMGTIVGEYVDTGINVSTMPGTLVGSHVTVGPGTAIMENIADNVLIYTKFQTVIKKSHNE